MLPEVASTSFFTLLVIGVSFLPVLALEAEEGRLFKPLAYTKTLAMVVAAVLAGIGSVAYSCRFIHDVFFNGEPVDLPASIQPMRSSVCAPAESRVSC